MTAPAQAQASQASALNGLVALVVFVFAGFLLYITRTPTGDLNTGAVALVGPPIGAVVAYFFHAQGSAQGAAISAAATAAGVTAAAGQVPVVKVD